MTPASAALGWRGLSSEMQGEQLLVARADIARDPPSGVPDDGSDFEDRDASPEADNPALPLSRRDLEHGGAGVQEMRNGTAQGAALGSGGEVHLIVRLPVALFPKHLGLLRGRLAAFARHARPEDRGLPMGGTSPLLGRSG
ncbi:MAG: hypothetical protein M0Z91_08015 [Actinomycetota bacterium]|nr:hypothetical protein [Actinomycetota bacterium]